MKILGVDTSGNTGSVAISMDGVILGEYTMNNKKTHSQTLMVMVDELCKLTETAISEIDAFAIAKGPGSFTGLRIGSATVKGFGLALNKPVVGVSTIEALAYNYYGSEKYICPIMDARRGQVYCGIYKFENDICEEILEPSAMSIEELIEIIGKEGYDVLFLGDGVPVHKEIITKSLGDNCAFAFGNNALQRGASVALLAERKYLAGEVETADEHAPIYLRVSQAERERIEKQGSEN